MTDLVLKKVEQLRAENEALKAKAVQVEGALKWYAMEAKALAKNGEPPR